MIDFDEELAKFKPSKEIDQAQDAIINMDLTDMTDVMMELMREKEQ